MGYCVDIVLRDVKFLEDKAEKVVDMLKTLNLVWQKQSDWCRFDQDLEDIVDIFEDIGFEVEVKSGFVNILYFEREKLGDHELMFESIAEYLEDCEIVYYGEDDCDWKQVVKNGKIKKEYREEF